MEIDREERNKIVLQYKYLVSNYARHYANMYQLEIEQLESYGYEELIVAIDYSIINKKKQEAIVQICDTTY